MAKEAKTVEIFKCPNCGQRNYVEWAKGQTSRSLVCINCYVEARKPQTMKNESGEDIIVEQITNQGFTFAVTRGKGEQFVRRELDHDLGREASWAVAEEGVADNG